jgi:hypothetical protein
MPCLHHTNTFYSGGGDGGYCSDVVNGWWAGMWWALLPPECRVGEPATWAGWEHTGRNPCHHHLLCPAYPLRSKPDY